ncbi:MAG: hypothetical protein JOZ27_02180, partial [Caulobacteraceae bacterium]|nr:hypothetical protein [Caulobacteraceae bacterium]
GTVQSAIVGDANGRAYTNSQVTALYDTYMGRDPSANELSVWDGVLAGGGGFAEVRSAILSDSYGVAHTNAEVTSLYDTYFARNPSNSELATWQGLIQGGDDFYQLTDTLARDGGSVAVVPRIDASGQTQVNPFPTSALNTDVLNFNANAAQIDLSASQHGGVNPLDAGHAHQITGLGGQTDVLITLPGVHSILIENTQLAALSASNFKFI